MWEEQEIERRQEEEQYMENVGGNAEQSQDYIWNYEGLEEDDQELAEAMAFLPLDSESEEDDDGGDSTGTIENTTETDGTSERKAGLYGLLPGQLARYVPGSTATSGTLKKPQPKSNDGVTNRKKFPIPIEVPPYTYYRKNGGESENLEEANVIGYVFDGEVAQHFRGNLKAIREGKNGVVGYILGEHKKAKCTGIFSDPKDHWHLLVYHNSKRPYDSSFHRAILKSKTEKE